MQRRGPLHPPYTTPIRDDSDTSSIAHGLGDSPPHCVYTSRYSVLPPVAAQQVRHDSGGGIWDWLVDHPTAAEIDDNHVDFISSVGLLELRGGGQEDDDVLSLIQTLGPFNDSVLEPERLCDGCSCRIRRADDIWALCHRGHTFCESCASAQCPLCPKTIDNEAAHVVGSSHSPGNRGCRRDSDISYGHVRRTVQHFELVHAGFASSSVTPALPEHVTRAASDDRAWLDEHVGRGTAAGGGVPIAPWARISGTDAYGRPTRICPSCGCDHLEDGKEWQHTRDGRFVCPNCSSRPADMNATTSNAAETEDLQWTLFGADREDPPSVPLQETISANLGHDSWPRLCVNCGAGLGCAGMSWRICVCGNTLCESCWIQTRECHRCLGTTSHYEQDGFRPAQDDLHIADESADGDDGSDWRGELGPAQSEGQCTPRGWHGTQLISPGQADELREDLRARHIDALRTRKARSKVIAREQVRAGTRPRKPRRPNHVDLITLNVNCANRLRDEVMSEDLFKNVDIGLIQEHREHGEGLDRLITWLRGRGWDPVGEEAYFKKRGYGGGPLVMARGVGIRPQVGPPEPHHGRVCWSEVELGGSVLTGSVYAISGQGAGKQIPLWRHIVQRVMTCGLPVILGGDWQLPPCELRAADFLRLIDAVVISSGKPTNLISGSELDYFIVSKSLLSGGDAVAEVDPSGAFSPHVAVRLSLPLGRPSVLSRRLQQPRLLPIERPIGPLQVAQYAIDWESWARGKDDNTDGGAKESLDKLTREWFAGAEIELIESHGMDLRDAAHYSGLGQAPVTVQANRNGRYSNVADELGLVGQRLAWSAKGLWTIIAAMGSPLGTKGRADFIAFAKTMAPRAMAFRREISSRQFSHDTPEHSYRVTLNNALLLIGRAGLRVRGIPPLLDRLAHCDYPNQLDIMRSTYNIVNSTLLAWAEHKRKRSLHAARLWARQASDKMAHRATKRTEALPFKSASADKNHKGELTDQSAADKGIVEWGGMWLAEPTDGGEDIIRQVVRIYESAEPGDHPSIALPALTGAALRKGALKFRSDTGVGVDRIRPRHFARLTVQALDALGRLLMLYEGRRRWADIAREVVEIARGKKAGGARLVGLGSSLYRLWARTRFEDVKATMEARVERPYLPAAPGKGSIRAVFDMSLTVEEARARGRYSATTSYDLRSYYEHITVTELARGARRFGLPLEITALLAHLYVGPRRIRVGSSVSRSVYPRRSILAGCSFALLVIRVIIIGPVEQLLELIDERLKNWCASFHPTFYVDDGVITTVGELDAVALLHGWITRLVLNWVRAVLHKDIAHHKSACVVSCRELRDRLVGDMAELGIKPRLQGEMLGVDFAAGGNLHKRPTQVTRRRKAMRRRSKIAWLRKLGGPAKRVAKTGAFAEQSYGGDVVGLPPAALRDARRIHSASTGVQCGGASLTAKLALGGVNYQEHDPAVLQHNPPLKMILRQVWDVPRCRAAVAHAWYRARNVITQENGQPCWANVNGPVSAAMAHIIRIGAAWPKAFVLRALDTDINILAVPPRTVMRVLAAHARRHYDHLMLRRLSVIMNWDTDHIIDTYRHGVHWDVLRDVLRGKALWLAPREKRILHVVAAGGFWPEERRWQAGLRKSPLCEACGLLPGTHPHRLHECDAYEADRALGIAAGVYQRLPAEALRPGLAPLVCMALPPLPIGWEKEDITIVEGNIDMCIGGPLYGDGSGFHQSDHLCRTSTWSLVRLDPSAPMDGRRCQRVTGSVGGWDQTVPRGELSALIAFLRCSSAGAYFVGDCRYVIEGARGGVSPTLMSSLAADPDLWRIVDRLIKDHGSPPHLVKVKAHRSLTRASGEGEASVQDWFGNSLADEAAKSLGKRRLLSDDRPRLMEESCELSVRVIAAVARGAAMAVARWPDAVPLSTRTARDHRHRKSQEDEEDLEETHVIRRSPPGHFECVVCRRVAYTALGARRMSGSTCPGAIHQAIHQSHRLCHSHGLTWCKACAAFSSRWPRQLLRECPGKPRSAAQKNVLKRLMTGLTPTTAHYLMDVARASGKPVTAVDTIDTVIPVINSTSQVDQADGTVPAQSDAVIDIGNAHRDGNGDIHGRLLPRHRNAPPRDDPRLARRLQDNDHEPAGPGPPRPLSQEQGGRVRHCYFNLEARRMRNSQNVAPMRGGDETQSSAPSLTSVSSDRARPGRSDAAAPGSARRLPQNGSCSRPQFVAHWSQHIAVGPSHISMRCSACGVCTRLRCSSCRQGLCMSCAKAAAKCNVAGNDDEGGDVPSASDSASQAPRWPGSAGDELVRRRLRGKTAPPSRPITASLAGGGGQHQHQHHHIVDAAGSGRPAPIFASEDCRHHHHHHGNSEADALIGCGTSPPNPNGRLCGQNSRHVEEPRQHTVVVAAPLTCSVPPLSQVLVGVAAEAADGPHASGSPHCPHSCPHTCLVSEDADCQDVSPSTSLSAAAASLSYDVTHS